MAARLTAVTLSLCNGSQFASPLDIAQRWHPAFGQAKIIFGKVAVGEDPAADKTAAKAEASCERLRDSPWQRCRD